MVYKGTPYETNAVLWAPRFAFITVRSKLRSIEKGHLYVRSVNWLIVLNFHVK